ncbi:MAG: 5-formyltetrahydrofolate cyclo-ligase, partial [Woeseiaceae bacterium]
MTNKPKPGDSAQSGDQGEAREFASPPCYQHEIAPGYQGPSRDDWAGVREWRKAQRTRLSRLRESIEPAERNRLTESIMDNLRRAFVLQSEVVAFYWPLPGEIDLRPLVTELASKGARLALPAIVGKDEPLEFRRWKPGDELDESGLWNIPTPTVRDIVTPTLIYVPLLGFDKDCHRLGHGGGFYDRTLAVPGVAPVTVGIAYESGRLATIYPQEHDIAINAIATERDVTF